MPFTEKQLKDASRDAVAYFKKYDGSDLMPYRRRIWEPNEPYRSDDMVDAMGLAFKTATAGTTAVANPLTANMRGVMDRMIQNLRREMERNVRDVLMFGAPPKFFKDLLPKGELKPGPLTFMGTKIHFDPIVPNDTLYFLSRKGLNMVTGNGKITGLSASGIIIDDPHNEGARAMSKVIATREQLLEAGITTDYSGNLVTDTDAGVKIVKGKALPVPKKDYNTVGMRFLQGPNLAKIYTYRIRKGAKVHLGQELVVPGKVNGTIQNSVAVVVEIHKTPQDTGPYEYKYVIGKVQPL